MSKIDGSVPEPMGDCAQRPANKSNGPASKSPAHLLVVLAYDGMSPLEYAIAVESFARNDPDMG